MCNVTYVGLMVKFNESTYSVDEDKGLVQPVLVLSNPSSYQLTIGVFSTDGTATGMYIWTVIVSYLYLTYYNFIHCIIGGVDYKSGPYNVTFLPGITNVTLDIPIIFDEVEEDDENFTLSISSNLPPLITKDILEAVVTVHNINSKYVYTYICMQNKNT